MKPSKLTLGSRAAQATLVVLGLALITGGCGDDVGAGGVGADAAAGSSGGALADGGVGDGVATDGVSPRDAVAEDGKSGSQEIAGTSGGDSQGDGALIGGDGQGDGASGGGDGQGDGASGGGDGQGDGASGGGDGQGDGGGQPAFDKLCNPCNANKGCADDAHKDAACVTHGPAIGSFCADTCTEDADCDKGYVCQELADVEGTKAMYCVPDGGAECECSDAAIKASATTTCSVTTSVGGKDATCTGARTCTDGGLTPCSAATPGAEVCDGEDNDCDGQIDGAGDCDDGNACTDDSCGGKTGCKHAGNAEKCDDGDACTDKDACKDGKCTGTKLNCDDKNSCTLDVCEPAVGCTVTNDDGAACEDGDKCTGPDTCQGGACVAGEPASCDDANPCTKNSCAVDSGKCATQTVADGTECDDGDGCTVSDSCAVGLCTSATQLDCDDGNACTADACEPAAGCTVTAAAGPCDDGNPCTTSSTCADKACVATVELDCDDGNACTADACDPGSGDCTHKAAPGVCDDGDKCTTADACDAGKCVGKANTCDDGNDCTNDSCDATTGCVHEANTDKCDDGDKCTTGDICGGGKCAGTADPKACDDENPCTKDSCDPTNGCQYANDDGITCNDGDSCTEGEACSGGKCGGGNDICQCTDSSQCADDGDKCNGTPTCEAGRCKLDPHTIVQCDTSKDTACAWTVCAPTDGACKLVLAASATDCNDNNPCTTESSCQAGKCVPTSEINCDDGNACTADSCNPADGKCLHKALPDCKACKADTDCNNGDLCADQCLAGRCEFVDAQVCKSLPDLMISGLVTLPAKAKVYTGGPIALAATFKNQGGGKAGATTATVKLVSATDPTKVIPLGKLPVGALGAGKSTVVKVKFSLPAGVTAGAWKLVVTADAGGAVKEASDLNNSRALPITVEPIADLTVAPLKLGASAYKQGASDKLGFKVTNTGTLKAPGYTDVVVLSADKKFDPGKDKVLKTLDASELLPGKFQAGELPFTIPANTPSGTYYLVFIADSTQKVPEVDEADNIRWVQIRVGSTGPANLVARAVAVPKKLYRPGEKVTAEWKLANTGDKAASGYGLGLYLVDPATKGYKPRLFATAKGPTIASKGAAKGTTTARLPTWLTHKTWTLLLIADYTGKVPESNEKDNAVTGPIGIAVNGPDLKLLAYSLGNSVYKTNAKIRINSVRANVGGIASGGFADRVYLSADKALDKSDLLMGTILRPSLAAGAKASSTLYQPVPKGAKPGAWYVIYRLDATDKVAETIESNNTYVVRVDLIAPNAKSDLVASSFKLLGSKGAPITKAVPGQRIYLSGAKVSNLSKVPAAAFTDAWVLSTNSYISSSDRLLRTFARSGLAAGASASASTSLLLPTNLTKGDYWIALWADRYDKVPEADKSPGNNIVKLRFDIVVSGPNLRASALTLSKTILSATDKLAFSYMRTNDGGQTASGYSDAFYLSRAPGITKDAILLAQYARPSLAPGKSAKGNPILPLPKGTKPGIYYLVYRTDSKNQVAETRETDNLRAVRFEIKSEGALPDLKPVLVGIINGNPGAKATITTGVSNLGAKGAPAFTAAIYLSADGVISSGDTKLGVLSFPKGAKAKTLVSASGHFTLPTGLRKGVNYWIGVLVDPEGKIKETLEGNNTLARAFKPSIDGADLEVTAFKPTAARDDKSKTWVYKAGTKVTFYQAHRNRGGVSTVKGYSAAVYLSKYKRLKTTERVASWTYKALPAGGKVSHNRSFAINPATPPGVYYLFYRVDDGLAISETRESNNLRYVRLTINPPPALSDLQVTALQPAVKSADPGAKVTISVSVKNAGKAAAGGFRVGLYTSKDAVIDPKSDTYRGYLWVKGLKAGATWSKKDAYIVLPTDLTKGKWYIGAFADYSGLVLESKEANNGRSAMLPIDHDGLDLVATKAFAKPASVVAGGKTVLAVAIDNPSVVSVSSYYDTYFYLSTDTKLGADLYLGRVKTYAHKAKTSVLAKLSVTLKSSVKPGKYHVLARVDATERKREINENNNVVATGLSVLPPLKRPDLDLTGAFVSTSPILPEKTTSVRPGSTYTMWITVKNVGDAKTGPYVTGLYFSANSTIGAGDKLLATVSGGDLLPGKQVILKRSFTVPRNLKKGAKFYLGARADHLDKIKEKSETNNTAAIHVTASRDGVDFRAVSVKPAKTLYKVGESVGVVYVRANEGDAVSQPSTDGLYLSPSYKFSAKTALLVKEIARGPLGGGQSFTGKSSFTIGAKLKPGTWYLHYRVNHDGKAEEYSTANNGRYVKIYITPKEGTADLASKALALRDFKGNPLSKSRVVPGQAVYATPYFLNRGNGATGPYVDGFYGSTSSSLTTARLGRLLSTSNRPSLAPSSKTSSYKHLLVVPTDLLKGSYYLKVWHDSGRKVVELSESNNAHSYRVYVSRNGIDLNAAYVQTFAGKTPRTLFNLGDTVSIAHRAVNQGQTDAPARLDGLYLSRDTLIDKGDIRLQTLKLPALGAGKSEVVRRAHWTIPKTLKPGKYYVGYVVDDGNHVAEYDEKDQVRFTGVITITSAVGLPDLRADSLLVSDKTVDPAQTVVLTSSIHNPGNAATGKSWRIGYFWSTDGHITTKDQFLEYQLEPSLKASATDKHGETVSVPTNFKKGVYYFGIIADYDGRVKEISETNNVRAIKVELSKDGRDLRPYSFGSLKQTYRPGDKAVLAWRTRNDGDIDSAPYMVNIYLSTDPTFGGDKYLYSSKNLPAIEANSTSGTSSAGVSIPKGTKPGIYYVILRVDAGNTNKEYDEGNNFKAFKIFVTSSAGAPDFTPTALYDAAPSWKPGQAVKWTVVVKNAGNAAAGGRYDLFSLGKDQIAGDADDFYSALQSRHTLIGAGKTETYARTTTLPTSLRKGTYYARVAIDAKNDRAESNESNNTRWHPFKVSVDGIDLRASGLSTKKDFYKQGENVAFLSKVTNAGGIDSGTSTTRFYLSRDAKRDKSDVDLGKTHVVPSLKPGATDSYSGVLRLPEGTKTGTWYLLAVADYNNVRKEFNETNNVAARKITVQTGYPDLYIYNPPGSTPPISVSPFKKAWGPGDTLTVKGYYRNAGTVASGTFKVGIYLSHDSIFTGADKLIGTVTRGSVGAGGHGYFTWTGKLPDGFSADGSAYIGFWLDYDGKIKELSETNNESDYYTERVKLNFSAARADLRSDYLISGQLYAYRSGKYVKVRYRRKNEGKIASGAFYSAFYYSSSAHCTSPKVIGEYLRPSLDAGKVYPSHLPGYATASFLIGYGKGRVPPGKWYICHRVDSRNQVHEYDEADNLAVTAKAISLLGDI